jgi:hypothetical protein
MTTRFADHLLTGTHAARPAATAVPEGTLYACADHGLVYQSDGAAWSTWATLGTAAAIPASLLDAKGDLIAASAADSAARLPVGPNGHVLTADSAQTTGIKWAAAAGGGGGAAATVPKIRTGATANRYYPASAITATALGTTVATANAIRALPFVSPQAITVDRLACQITAGASGNLRLGIYADDGNVYPGTLLVDSGNISTSSTGVVTATVSQALAASTLYWFVFFSSTASIQVRALAASQMTPIVGFVASGFSFPSVGWSASLAFAALPTPYPAAASTIDSGPVETVFIRAA